MAVLDRIAVFVHRRAYRSGSADKRSTVPAVPEVDAFRRGAALDVGDVTLQGLLQESPGLVEYRARIQAVTTKLRVEEMRGTCQVVIASPGHPFLAYLVTEIEAQATELVLHQNTTTSGHQLAWRPCQAASCAGGQGDPYLDFVST